MYFKHHPDRQLLTEPSEPFVTEPGRVFLTIIRDGPVNREVSVRYRTSDGSAKVEDNDYIPIISSQAVFESGQREYSISVDVLQDSKPETDESFFVELYNPEPEGTKRFWCKTVAFSQAYNQIFLW